MVGRHGRADLQGQIDPQSKDRNDSVGCVTAAFVRFCRNAGCRVFDDDGGFDTVAVLSTRTGAASPGFSASLQQSVDRERSGV
jgi:hypothetical protein